MIETIEVAPGDAGRRLDQVLASAFPHLSRSLLKRLIDDDHVRMAGSAVKPGRRLHAGESIVVDLRLPPSLSADPEPIVLSIVYEDAMMVVIDKPAGLVVHPAPGHPSGTLVNAIVHRYPHVAEEGNFRPGLVHRLDKNTSGLMVVALTPEAQAALALQIKRRTAGREYLALVAGHPDRREYRVDAPIGRDAKSRLRMAVGPNTIKPRAARSSFIVEEYAGRYALLRVRLETGRTHQVRVHLAFAGYPVAGDSTYGGPKLAGLSRQFLHATGLELTSPRNGERLRFESPLPPDLARILDRLRTDM